MKPEKLETWVWVLIYGGLLAVCLGVFVMRRGGDALGWALVVAGVLAVVAGMVLVVVRARMKPPGR